MKHAIILSEECEEPLPTIRLPEKDETELKRLPVQSPLPEEAEECIIRVPGFMDPLARLTLRRTVNFCPTEDKLVNPPSNTLSTGLNAEEPGEASSHAQLLTHFSCCRSTRRLSSHDLPIHETCLSFHTTRLYFME